MGRGKKFFLVLFLVAVFNVILIFQIAYGTRYDYTVPYLYQLDYANAPHYIGHSACAPTSLAMLLRYYFPNSGIDVPEVYHSGIQGYSYHGPAVGYKNVSFQSPDRGLSIVDPEFRQYYSGDYSGLRSPEAAAQYLNSMWEGESYGGDASLETIIDQIREYPLILNILWEGKRNWVEDHWELTGHYVVLRGYDDNGTPENYEDDIFYVNDPWLGQSNGENRQFNYDTLFGPRNWQGDTTETGWYKGRVVTYEPTLSEQQRQYTVVVDNGNVQLDDVNNQIWWEYYGPWNNGGDWYYPTEDGYWVIWAPNLLIAANYNVHVIFHGDSLQTDVTYTIYNLNSEEIGVVTINQNISGWQDVSLGIFYLEKGSFVKVNNVSAQCNVDAIRFEYEGTPEEQLILAVTDPYYDDIGSILTAMGYDFVEIQDSQLADYDFIKDFDAIFINCSSHSFDNAPAAETSLRQYVQNGGAIYASDWAFIYLETSFPEYIDFPADPYVGVAQYVTATVTDPGLAQYLGTDIVDLYYNLEQWVAISDVGPDTDILLQGSYEIYSLSKVLLEKGKRLRTLKSSLAAGKASTMTDKPLAVFFRYGDGSVTYTTFHNEAQITDLQQKLLEYLVLKPVTSEIARDLIDQIIQWGGSVVGETIDTISQGDTSTFIYVSSEVQDLMFGLGWPGSTMKLSIYRPDDTLYAQKQSSASPIFVEVLNAEAGEWTYKVTAMDVAYDNYPFVVEIGSKAPSEPLSITVYPSPCYLNTGQTVKIANLPLNSEVYIYTISGELVRTLDDASEISVGGSSTTAFWDCKNDAGEEVARGIYIYLATDNIGTKRTGKIAIIK